MKLRGLVLAKGRGWLVGAGLLLLLLAYFWPVVLQGRSLLPTDAMFYYDPVWKSFANTDDGPSNELLLDIVAQFYPYMAFNQQALGEGVFPLWNPQYLTGHAYFAGFQPALLFPLNWFFLWDVKAAWGLTAILKLWLAALFTYAYLREMKLGRWGALVGAVTFALSGYFVVRLNYTLANVQMWLPLLLWLTEKIIKRPGLKWLLLAAGIYAVQFFAGHPESSFALSLVWALYAVYRLAGCARGERSLRPALKPAGLLAGAAALGLLIAAVQLLPFVQLLRESATMSNRAELLTAENWSPNPPLAELGRHLLSGVNVLLPNFFGTPLDDNYWTPLLQTKKYHFEVNYFSQTRYLGLVALWLAGLGAVRRWRDPPVPFFAVLAVLSLGLDLRLPGLALLFEIPPLSLAGNNVAPGMLMAGPALLAGFGADTLARETQPTKRAWTGLFGLWLATLLAAVLMYAAVRAWSVDQWLQSRLDHETMLALYRPFSWRLHFPLVFGLAGIGLMAARRWVPVLAKGQGPVLSSAGGRRVISALLLLLVAGELYAFGWDFNPTIQADQVFPETEAIRFLRNKAGLQRVNGLTIALKPNSSLVFGLYDIGGYEDLSPSRYRRFMWNQVRDWERQGDELILGPDADRLLDLTGVRYVVVPYSQISGSSGAGYRPAFEDGNVYIHDNLDVLPRAYVVHQAEVVPDEQAALERVYAPDFHPESCVILEYDSRMEDDAGSAGDGIEQGCAPVEGNGAAAADLEPAQILSYDLHQVTVGTSPSEDGYLVLTDLYDPDWQVQVDGEPVPLLRANDVFRAVRVPAGEHIIAFRYSPRAVWAGLALTLAGLGIVLGIGLVAMAPRLRSAAAARSRKKGAM